MTTGKLNLICLGFDRLERSYQPRFINLSIVPGHFKELAMEIIADN